MVEPTSSGIDCGGGVIMELEQGQKKIAIILPKNRDTAIFNRLYIRLYIKFVANIGEKSRFRTCRDFILSLN